ncbi:MAG TPA: radical SAM protein [Methylococcaceae bacterium]|jgi:wyosine [tRNA(Phe)-imidazoG37] synthetase (radical SAM superfamily)|nr:radical SAM protein [Methylococcaceae bacterium]HIN69158.1 radical SAM protein [Methylococcales bacterium]HIA46263.1 radical SAM protein [Methylococcaceae bacterium]HIB62302.1 radical SAM protein [Methylococcaceae bacterium]HIO12712.1 radical SAM protein [Methylococcales bacterium]
MATRLTIRDHNRDVAGLTYVYPVLSRRAGGVSVGINFNVNNACNWRCVYCQVPNLSLGSAPDIDLLKLREELCFFLGYVDSGRFYKDFSIDPKYRDIKDISISGNGEPTSLDCFYEAIEVIKDVLESTSRIGQIPLVLITNGSLLHRKGVRRGLALWGALGGHVWFKVDSASLTGRQLINNTMMGVDRMMDNLKFAAQNCDLWLQTCLFNYKEKINFDDELKDYHLFLLGAREKVKIQGIYLYTIARPSLQPEALAISPMQGYQLDRVADGLRRLGFKVQVSY